jgi:hypothetical protein
LVILSTGTMIVVGSEACAFAEAPPETLTWFVSDAVALMLTFTVTVIVGKLDAAANASDRVHVVPPAVQVQPVPAMATSVSPDGTVSVIVTVPLVDAVPVLATVTV